jgi:hypothetical protein
MIELGERVLRQVVAWHYHIPKLAYWILFLGGAVALGLVMISVRPPLL